MHMQTADNRTKVSCNSKQCASSECWSRKGYARLAEKRIERDKQIRNMPAIKDKESGERRELTGKEKEMIANNIDEARSRRLRKLKIAESRAKAEEVREHRKKEAEDKEIDDAIGELVDEWSAETMMKEEDENEAEEDAVSQSSKKAKTSN